MHTTGGSLWARAWLPHWFFGLVVVVAMLLVSTGPLPAAEIVRDGVPKAQIVVAPQPLRMVGLAALELQNTVERMSGARLPIDIVRSDDFAVTIYVGRSADTDALGVTDDGLRFGAYRIVSIG